MKAQYYTYLVGDGRTIQEHVLMKESALRKVVRYVYCIIINIKALFVEV